jgi:hypothetical protein
VTDRTGFVEVEHPVQPSKVEAGPGVAVRVTAEFARKPAEQVPGQEIPDGLLDTLPVPLPVRATVTWTGGSNSAVQVTTAPIALQVLVTVFRVEAQSPVHLVKVEPGSGEAVRTNVEGAEKVTLQTVVGV